MFQKTRMTLLIAWTLAGSFTCGTRCVAQEQAAANPNYPRQTPQEFGRQMNEDLDILSTIVKENLAAAFQLKPKSIWMEQLNNSLDLPATATFLPSFGVSIVIQTPPVRDLRRPPPKQEQQTMSRWEITAKRLRGELKLPKDAHHQSNARCADCHDLNNQWFANAPQVPQDSVLTLAQLCEALIKILATHAHNLRGVDRDSKVAITTVTTVAQQPPVESDFQTDAYMPSRSENTKSFLAAQLLLKQGRKDEAMKVMEKYLQKHPHKRDDWIKIVQLIAKHRGINLKDFPAESFAEAVARGQSFHVSETDVNRRRDFANRLAIDLTGLPASKEVLADFVNDRTPKSITELVFSLLKDDSKASAFLNHAGLSNYYRWSRRGSKPKKLRLTVSAFKRVIDNVGSKKISIDEFKRQIEISYVEEG